MVDGSKSTSGMLILPYASNSKILVIKFCEGICMDVFVNLFFARDQLR